MKSAGIILVGCGTVGAAVASLLVHKRELLAQRSGIDLHLRHVVDLDFTRAIEAGVDEAICTSDLDTALADDEASIVVELVGGTTIARTLVEKALRAGRHVVTANKALLAHYGAELMALARENGACIAFEASCAGGIPILGALQEGLIANEIEALYGIVNGTCNYILTEMSTNGGAYPEVLSQAQADGLAEADPTLDVSGEDSAHKIAILAALAFGLKIDYAQVSFEGIDTLALTDLQYGWEFGYTMKLLAIAERIDGRVNLRVHPAFIRDEHPLARVNGAFNAVSVFGSTNGHTLYHGRGAGGSATSSAVVADIAAVAAGTALQRFNQLGIWPDRSPAAEFTPIAEIRGRYYLRLNCLDNVGVLATIAEVFENHSISLAGVLQHEQPDEAEGEVGASIIITTHVAREGDVRDALAELDSLDVVRAPSVLVRIVDERAESLL